MIRPQFIHALILATATLAVSLTGCSDEAKAKPYPLDTCLVCDMKLDSPSQTCAFVYQGQQIKLCDKSERADFDKDPGKYLKKLADSEAKLKK